MATYYWVGGNGNWGASETTNWASSSGGAGGAGFPTSYDNVVFDANSNTGTAAFAVTVTGVAAASSTCANFDASAVDGVMTLTLGATGYLACYGSWVNPASNFAFSLTTGHTILFGATSLGKTVNLNNVSAVGINILFSGVGGGWTLAGAVNSPGASGAISVTSGSFDTGNQTISLGQFNTTGTGTRSVTLGSSIITLGGTTPWNAVSTGLTFSAGTSTIACSSASSLTFAGGGLTYNNVSFTDTTATGTTITISGNSSFNNITVASLTVTGSRILSVASSTGVTGTLTLGTANTPTRRLQVQSGSYGTRYAISVATMATLSDVDFRDISITGAASPVSGTRLGNLLNNAGITFPAAKTVYWNLVGGGNWSDTAWATSSGGTPAAVNFPLAQDTVVIENTGLNASATITFDALWNVGNVSASTRSNAMTWTNSTGVQVYGTSFVFSSAISSGGSQTWNFNGQGITQTITLNGATLQGNMAVNAPNSGTVQLGSAYSSNGVLTVTNGTFDTANYAVNCSFFSSNNSNTRTFLLGSSAITLNGATPMATIPLTGLTFNAGTSTISCPAAGSFITSGLTFYNVSLNGTTAATITVTGAGTFNNLTIASPTVAGYKTITFDSNQTINGAFSPGAGGTATNRVRIRSSVFGTARTLTAGTLASTSDVDFRDIVAAGASTPWSGTRIGNDNGNSNITFTAAKTVYWNLAGAQNWSATAWATSSGGTPAVANFPLPQDTAVFDNTGSVTGTITFDTGWNIGTLNVTKTGAMTIALGTTAPSVLGSVTLQAATIITGTSALSFTGTGTQVLTSNNCSFAPPITLTGIGGTVQLGSNFTTTSNAIISHSYGTFDTNNFNFTAAGFSSSNTNTRAILLGSGTHTFSGATAWDVSTTTGLTLTRGTSTIICSNQSTAFSGGGLTYYNVSLSSTSTGSRNINGANTFNNLSVTSPASAVSEGILLGADQTVGATLTLGAGGTASNRLTVQSSTVGTQRTISAATLAALSDVDFRDIVASGASAPWSGTRVGDLGNNSGITFTAAKTVYWSLVAGGAWQTANAWATSSGGAPAVANFPLPQDTVIIDDTGLTTGNTITVNNVNVPTVNVTKTPAFTWAFGTFSPNISGSITLQSATVVTGTGAWSFYSSSGTPVLSTNGSVLPVPITLQGGNLQLGTAVTTTGGFSINGGALDITNKTLTANAFGLTGTNTRSIAFGSTGNITLTGNSQNVCNMSTMTGFSFTGTSALNLTYSGSVGTRIITSGNTAGATESNVMNFNISAGGDIVSFTTTGQIKSLNLTGFAGSIASTNKGIFGNLTVPTTTAFTVGTSTTSFTGTTGIAGTQVITTNGVVLDSNVVFSGTATYQLAGNFNTSGGALTSSTTSLISGTIDLNGYVLSAWTWGSNYSSTRAIAFNGGSISIIGNNQNVWSMATMTNFTYTGTSVINFTYAGSVGTRTITSGSTGGSETNAMNFNFTAGTDIISITSAATVRSLNFTGFAGTYTPLSKSIYGNFTMPAGVTVNTGTAANSFVATSGTQVITTNGVVQDYPITFANTTTVQLGGNLTVGPSSTAITTFTTGTLDLNGYVLSTHSFSSTNSNTRDIAFNSGSITITGNNATVWNMNTTTGFTYTGTPTVNLTYSGAVGTRSISHGVTGGSQANAVSLAFSGGSDIVAYANGCDILNLSYTGFTGSTTQGTGTFNLWGNLTYSTGMTLTSGACTFSATSSKTITMNGVTANINITFDGVGGQWAFQDAFTQNSANTFTLTNGTIKFKASTTNVVGSFVTSGTTQKYLLSDTPNIQATLSQASGTVNANYLTLQDNNATGGATFNAFTDAGSSSSSNNVNNGNVTGWNFIPDAGGFLMLFPLDS
jgi:hypothetical protein